MNISATRKLLFVLILIGLTSASLLSFRQVNAQEEGFSLQVTPSPLIATIQPGQTSELELKIRNTNIKPETLKMGLNSFSINSNNGDVELSDNVDPGLEGIVSFSSPVFTVDAGEWFTQKIIVKVPEDSGFTYSFATTISRADPSIAVEGSTSIEGSVAVFTLLSVDKPGATRSLDISSFSADKKFYEYLPASFSVKMKNTGNSIVQPQGNIFIQRGYDDKNPITVVPLNKEGGYIIPDSDRIFSANWEDGFPRFQKNESTGKSSLKWNFADASNFRIGKYTAKLVAVYDDGERDVPIYGEVTFWVIPWKQISLMIIALLLMVFGAFSIIRGLLSGIKNKKATDEKIEKTQ